MLMAATMVAFLLVPLCVWQVPGLTSAWAVLTVVAASLSTLLLVLFWSGQLVIGLLINALLVTGALTRPGLLERFMGAAVVEP